MIWHSSETNSVLSFFEVDQAKGLPTGVADARLKEYGKNLVSVTKKSTFSDIFINYFKSYSNVLVLLCTVLSLIIYLLYDQSKWYFPVLSVIVLMVYAFINVLSIKKCEAVIDNMKNKATAKVTVLRDGITKKIDASLLVPGDILILEQGDYISADARLISANELRCDEQFVTGETVIVEKNAFAVFDDITDIKNRLNMVYSGSSVVSGNGKAIVTDTAMNSEIGKRVKILKDFDSLDINLKERFTTIGKIAGIILLLSCLLIFLINVIINFRTEQKFAVMLAESLLNSVALLVSVLPEGLPIVAGITVSLSVLQLLNNGIIIKDLSAFDRLPDVSVICADKTGILTKNEMQVVSVYNSASCIDGKEVWSDPAACILMRMASLCTNQTHDDVDNVMYNDPTEVAIVDCCMEAIGDITADFWNKYPRVCKIPFNPERKIMTSVNIIDGKPFAITKGAPDYLLPLCNEVDNETVNQQIEKFTSLAYRVIAVAFKPLNDIPVNPTSEELECDLQFMGLIALEDKLQDGIVDKIEKCEACGISTSMLTGDHCDTAKTIARRLGILKNENSVMNGTELTDANDDFLAENILNYKVFARISPIDKERIINALKSKGECVAVTGDSVNDAPALKAADIGVSLGSIGTDVARGASDIILENNSYNSIITAIAVSKRLFSTLKNVATYLFSCNIGEYLAVFISLLIYKKFPIIALQLLLINLITDSFPVFSIISDSIKNPTKLSVRNANDKKVFTVFSAIKIIIQALIISLVTVTACSIGKTDVTDYSQTMTFLVLIFSQLFNMITLKNDDFFWKIKHFKKSWANIALIVASIFVCIFTLTPLAATVGLSRLTFGLFLKGLLISSLALISGEITKLGMLIFNTLTKQNSQ